MTKDVVVLLKGKINIESLMVNHKDATIYAMDNSAHILLEQNSIQHEIADEKLTDDDFNAIFDKVVSLYNWYDGISNSSEFEIDGINFFSVLDTQELHTFLANFLYDFLIIKRIIEEDLPKKIIVSYSLRKTILPFLHYHDFDHETLKSDKIETMVYESIEIKFNFGKIPISFSLSRNNYLKLKSLIEKTVCIFYNLWPDRDTSKRSLLFLEMNPVDYELLIAELSDEKTQILFLNNRRPATWSKRSTQILHQYGCKIIDLHSLLSKNERKEIEDKISQLKQKIFSLKNDDGVKRIFTYDGTSFLDGIDDDLLSTFENRIRWYVFLLRGVKNTLVNFNIKYILSLNVVGETEKVVLSLNKNKIPSIMIEHAFANYAPQISRYDILSMYSLFKDRIAVWGEIQKSYLMSQHGIEENRIIVSGSPRHDVFFTKKPLSNSTKKLILITPRPIIDTALHKKVKSYQKYERLLERIIKYFEKIDDVKVIIKTHPGLDSHNSEIKRIIHKNNPDVAIYQNVPIRELIEAAYVHINISPEGFDISTVVLESLTMNVPVMNIILDEIVHDFEVNKMNAIKNTFDDSTLEKHLDEIVFDKSVRELLIQNGQKFLHKYLSNMGSASKYLAKELKKLQD
jgi:hypothetical protein